MARRPLIPHGYYLLNNNHGEATKESILAGILIGPSEYTPDMKEHIFCPTCFQPLIRTPGSKTHDRRGHEAYFRHHQDPSSNCPLKSHKIKGKTYSSEEDARQAIERKELVVVHEFLRLQPNPPIPFDQPNQFEPPENEDGTFIDAPISIHKGKKFTLPSINTTIWSICQNFDENLNRYYLLPRQNSALPLIHQLIDISGVNESYNEGRLYYGRVASIEDSRREEPSHLRCVKLEYSKGTYPDFYLTASNEYCDKRRLTQDSIGKVVLMFGKVTQRGMGLGIQKAGWGEFALLPEQYSYLLS